MAVARAPRRVLTAPLPKPAKPAKKQPRADLRIVDRPRRGALVTTAFVVAALFGVLFALVVFHTVMLESQQRLDRLDDDVSAAQSHYEKLRLEVAQLEAPQRLVDAATQKLGMVPAAGTVYLTPSTPAPTTTTPAPGDANDAAPQANEWPKVKPYLGGARR